MINLDDQSIEFPCLHCGFYNTILYKQARLKDVIICPGCKSNIQLDVQMDECQKAEWAIRKAMQELKKNSNRNIEIKINL